MAGGDFAAAAAHTRAALGSAALPDRARPLALFRLAQHLLAAATVAVPGSAAAAGSAGPQEQRQQLAEGRAALQELVALPVAGAAAAVRPGAVALAKQLAARQGRALVAAHDEDGSGRLAAAEVAAIEDAAARAAMELHLVEQPHHAAAGGLAPPAAPEALFRHTMAAAPKTEL